MAQEDNPNVDKPLNPKPVIGPKSSNRAMLILVLFVVVLALISYFAFHHSNKSTQITSNSPARIAPALVSITSKGFNPATIQVKVGQAVDWTNTDKSPHYVVNDNQTPLFSSKGPIYTNNSFSYTFNKAGNYAYHDSKNLSLSGEVVVK